jgi:hypothetical protein
MVGQATEVQVHDIATQYEYTVWHVRPPPEAKCMWGEWKCNSPKKCEREKSPEGQFACSYGCHKGYCASQCMGSCSILDGYMDGRFYNTKLFKLLYDVNSPAVTLGRGVQWPQFFDHLAKLRHYGKTGQSKFDHDHPQDYKIFIVKMVNRNLIMTISTISDFSSLKLLKFAAIVEISVDFYHLTMTNWWWKWYYGHGQSGNLDHDHMENLRVLWSWLDPPPHLGHTILANNSK